MLMGDAQDAVSVSVMSVPRAHTLVGKDLIIHSNKSAQDRRYCNWSKRV